MSENNNNNNNEPNETVLSLHTAASTADYFTLEKLLKSASANSLVNARDEVLCDSAAISLRPDAIHSFVSGYI